MLFLLIACVLIVGAVGVIAWSMMPYVPALDDPFDDQAKKRPGMKGRRSNQPSRGHAGPVPF